MQKVQNATHLPNTIEELTKFLAIPGQPKEITDGHKTTTYPPIPKERQKAIIQQYINQLRTEYQNRKRPIWTYPFANWWLQSKSGILPPLKLTNAKNIKSYLILYVRTGTNEIELIWKKQTGVMIINDRRHIIAPEKIGSMPYVGGRIRATIQFEKYVVNGLPDPELDSELISDAFIRLKYAYMKKDTPPTSMFWEKYKYLIIAIGGFIIIMTALLLIFDTGNLTRLLQSLVPGGN